MMSFIYLTNFEAWNLVLTRKDKNHANIAKCKAILNRKKIYKLLLNPLGIPNTHTLSIGRGVALKTGHAPPSAGLSALKQCHPKVRCSLLQTYGNEISITDRASKLLSYCRNWKCLADISSLRFLIFDPSWKKFFYKILGFPEFGARIFPLSSLRFCNWAADSFSWIYQIHNRFYVLIFSNFVPNKSLLKNIATKLARVHEVLLSFKKSLLFITKRIDWG